ncbi:metallophosphoesterase [Megasphaera paucivorans]|uniref:3',5'-cyclic AMP phosphodiesterase CpdA n=1 Tax=Megasphaera paucivorans TaxID=349095 RepID=A0A1G9QHC2_9FIRM|nr:metallophosphoesterase [Megasphaera paucivorans]SDM09887.1 3',5'-cyclic AMP phosphodiesterase CpdA [Megasphaera paucivorans]
MKLAIVHISDFHVNDKDQIINEKIEKFLNSLNVLSHIDKYIIAFSGDLAYSGEITEYKKSRYVIGKIIAGIKKKNNQKFIDMLIVPGNHDLTLTKEVRDNIIIQGYYDKNCIESIVENEIKLLDNFYTYSHANFKKPNDKIIDKRFCRYKDYCIQFNLINTALFSTLNPDDKELHYFPQDKMNVLDKDDEANLCITIMHHGWEWFNPRYKSNLEHSILSNSEILLLGHDHYADTKAISNKESFETWISCAGAMNFSELNFSDSFNSIIINTDDNTFCGYIFNWNYREKIFIHELVIENKNLLSKTRKLNPLQSYVKTMKEDIYYYSKDFTQYFVFPKLISEHKNEFGKYEEIKTGEALLEYIDQKKKILILGESNSGKSTLLKYLYLVMTKDKLPLFLFIDSATKINSKNFIRRLFEDQYGDNSILFEKYQQTEKNKKVLIVDGWEQLKEENKKQLQKVIEVNFDFIIFSANEERKNIVELVENEIVKADYFEELRIKPFFAEKRSQLVKKICLLNSTYTSEDADGVNKLIDRLVYNNSNLFSLNPGFIIRYTDYFTKEHYCDYTKGEAIFSQIFEYELHTSIMRVSKDADINQDFIVFEKIAGYMYEHRKDILKQEEVRDIVDKYNALYGMNVYLAQILKIGEQAKLFKNTEDCSIYFVNKNYLAYFIAKHLLRVLQDDKSTGNLLIQYALKNICFGINSDIILFISYLSGNTKIVMLIAQYAGELLYPWKEFNLNESNISFLKQRKFDRITTPTPKDHDNMKQNQEIAEERKYQDCTIEAKGLFEYNEKDIDEYPYRLIRAIKYTEMICKALPAFNSSILLEQKKHLVELIYSYPHKIVFAMLEPIDEQIDIICEKLLKIIKKKKIEKKEGVLYNEEDIREMFSQFGLSMILNTYDHFSELCTSQRTIELLLTKEYKELNKNIERLMIVENLGDTEKFIKEAEKVIKNFDVKAYYIVGLIARKHLMCNPQLSYTKRQQIIDKFFLGKHTKTNLLMSSLQKEKI